MSAAALAWLYRALVLVHVGGVVTWMGAVAYYLLILRPAMTMAGLERRERYALLVAIKARLRRVVGGAVVALVASGLAMAWLRGLLTGDASPWLQRVFAAKMVVVAALVLIFLFALQTLQRVQPAARRGWWFNATHVIVLLLGALAAAGGIVLSR